jgi:Zn-dependent metalloprotease
MKAPGTAWVGDSQPSTMDGYRDLPDDNDPANDNGGVHINSGIPNHAFYLTAMTLGGHAWERAGQVWFRTLTEELDADSQFDDAAAATVAVAGRLFPDDPAVETAVRDAWTAVGVLS